VIDVAPDDCVTLDRGSRDERGDLTPSADRRLSLVEDHEHCRPRRAEERWEPGREKRIGNGKRAVVAVVAKVWRNECVGRQVLVVETRERMNMRCAVPEVEKRHVLFREPGR
jgi:hypothetical protein